MPVRVGGSLPGGHDVLHEVGFAVCFQAAVVPHAPHGHLQLLLIHAEDGLPPQCSHQQSALQTRNPLHPWLRTKSHPLSSCMNQL